MAHPEVVRTESPTESPTDPGAAEYRVVFTEDVTPLPARVELFDVSGRPVAVGDATAEKGVLTVRPVTPGEARSMRWSVRGDDSHVVSGMTRFGDGATVGTLAAGSGWDRLGDAGRALVYAGTLVAVGMLAFTIWSLERHDGDRRVLLGLGRLAAATVAVATVAELVGRFADVAGAGFPHDATRSHLRAALAGDAGIAAGLRIAGACAVAASAHRSVRFALLGAGAVVVSLPLAGHTAAVSPEWLAVAGGAVHVAAASVWMGGVVALAVVVSRRRLQGHAVQAGALARRFTRVALVMLAGVTATGVLMALAILERPSGLVDTPFGRLLLAKTAAVVAVVAVALAVRRAWRNGTLRRLAWVEVGLLAVVVAITAVLVDARIRERVPFVEVSATADAAADAAADGGAHSHGVFGPVEEVPLTGAETERLEIEWNAASRAALSLLDADAARAAGYVPSSAPVPGVGVHWINWSLVGQPFDPAEPSMLLFDHEGDEPRLAGFSYWVGSTSEPEGFAGLNDHWHRHFGICFVRGWHRGEDVPADECEGEWVEGSDLWMLHAWVVPDLPNRWGRFAPTHPDLCPPWNTVPDIVSCQPLR